MSEHLIKKDWNPNVVPTEIGQHWVNKIAKRHWFSVGTNSMADWVEMSPFVPGATTLSQAPKGTANNPGLPVREHLIERTHNPDIVPGRIGQHWVNTETKLEWFSVGTGGMTDWVQHPRTSDIAAVAPPVDRILNVASFASYTPKQPNTIVETLGYHEVGDNGHASYYIDENDLSTPSDGGSVFAIADGRRAKLRIDADVNVKAFGAVGDGVTDDTAAFQAWLTFIGNDTRAGYVPRLTFKITATLNPAPHCQIYFDKSVLKSTVAGACIRLASGAKLKGVFTVDCQNTAGSVGLQLGNGQKCEHAEIESVSVINAETGVQFRSNGPSGDLSSGVYMNKIAKCHALDCGVGIHFWSNLVGASEANANRFDFASCQRCTVTPLKIEGGDGNSFGFYEAEVNYGGFAIDLIKARGFYVDGGWVEGNTGNLRIANDPDVKGVYIRAVFDSVLDGADTKFVYTHSNARSVFIHRSDWGTHLGIMRVGGELFVGSYGGVANDQSMVRMQLASGMDLFRYSAANPYFLFRAQSGGGLYFGVDGGVEAMRLQTDLTAVFVGNVAISGTNKGVTWDNATEFIRRKSTADAVEIGVNTTVAATFDGSLDLTLAGHVLMAGTKAMSWDNGTEFVRRTVGGDGVEIGVNSVVAVSWGGNLDTTFQGNLALAATKALSWDSGSEFLRRKSGADALEMGCNGTVLMQLDTAGAAGDTRFILYDVSAGALKRVSLGAADSGGSGYKMLRVVN